MVKKSTVRFDPDITDYKLKLVSYQGRNMKLF